MAPKELSKKEKKIAREIIDKGINAEFKDALTEAKAVITEWELGKLNNRDGYHKLFKAIMDQDKWISKRYDGLKGSRYLVTVALILYNGQITEEDIKDFSDEAKATIQQWVSGWREDDL